MEIKIFGPGCARCNQTENLVKEVVATKNEPITVQKISDLEEMMLAGIISTPAVMVNGIVKSVGKIPSKEEIEAWISGTEMQESPCCQKPTPPPSNSCCCNNKK